MEELQENLKNKKNINNQKKLVQIKSILKRTRINHSIYKNSIHKRNNKELKNFKGFCKW